ncbi:MAG: GTP-binding protein, partial [Rectinema sp.]|nr:GTP-binding protein [Rectinema sp.]
MESRRHIRNIGILAHIDAGKTSVTERVLHVAGVRREAGSVDEGTTATDYLSVEQQHGITIKTAAVRFNYKQIRFHLLDTPGHVDFSAEVDRVLRVLDGAVIILCAVSGVQVRTGFIAKACRDHALPRIYFINKMDRRGADFAKAVQEIQTELGEIALPLQIPTFEDYRWTGIADLVRELWYPVDVVDGAPIPVALARAPLSSGSREEVRRARELLIDHATEHDDTLLAAVLANEPVSPGQIIEALRPSILEQKLVPVLCGSSFEDISISLLLDAVIDYFPSPEERGCPVATDMKTGEIIRLTPNATELLSAYIFKTVLSRDLEPVAWLRIWSGTVRENAKVTVMPAGKSAVVQRLYGVSGAEVERITEA